MSGKKTKGKKRHRPTVTSRRPVMSSCRPHLFCGICPGDVRQAHGFQFLLGGMRMTFHGLLVFVKLLSDLVTITKGVVSLSRWIGKRGGSH
jgi:hypothetical protein